ncbi:hypothetical protein ENBRE01_0851 [Enteropsectra breve]|nr:hypothetical protein ENBRE01_0851 [Enteropsectra breve]
MQMNIAIILCTQVEEDCAMVVIIQKQQDKIKIEDKREKLNEFLLLLSRNCSIEEEYSFKFSVISDKLQHFGIQYSEQRSAQWSLPATLNDTNDLDGLDCIYTNIESFCGTNIYTISMGTEEAVVCYRRKVFTIYFEKLKEMGHSLEFFCLVEELKHISYFQIDLLKHRYQQVYCDESSLVRQFTDIHPHFNLQGKLNKNSHSKAHKGANTVESSICEASCSLSTSKCIVLSGHSAEYNSECEYNSERSKICKFFAISGQSVTHWLDIRAVHSPYKYITTRMARTQFLEEFADNITEHGNAIKRQDSILKHSHTLNLPRITTWLQSLPDISELVKSLNAYEQQKSFSVYSAGGRCQAAIAGERTYKTTGLFSASYDQFLLPQGTSLRTYTESLSGTTQALSNGDIIKSIEYILIEKNTIYKTYDPFISAVRSLKKLSDSLNAFTEDKDTYGVSLPELEKEIKEIPLEKIQTILSQTIDWKYDNTEFHLISGITNMVRRGIDCYLDLAREIYFLNVEKCQQYGLHIAEINNCDFVFTAKYGACFRIQKEGRLEKDILLHISREYEHKKIDSLQTPFNSLNRSATKSLQAKHNAFSQEDTKLSQVSDVYKEINEHYVPVNKEDFSDKGTPCKTSIENKLLILQRRKRFILLTSKNMQLLSHKVEEAFDAVLEQTGKILYKTLHKLMVLNLEFSHLKNQIIELDLITAFCKFRLEKNTSFPLFCGSLKIGGIIQSSNKEDNLYHCLSCDVHADLKSLFGAIALAHLGSPIKSTSKICLGIPLRVCIIQTEKDAYDTALKALNTARNLQQSKSAATLFYCASASCPPLNTNWDILLSKYEHLSKDVCVKDSDKIFDIVCFLDFSLATSVKSRLTKIFKMLAKILIMPKKQQKKEKHTLDICKLGKELRKRYQKYKNLLIKNRVRN